MIQIEELERRITALEQMLTPAETHSEPRPLLSDAQVGDIVRLRNGEYRQIECRETQDNVDFIVVRGCYYALNGQAMNRACGDTKDIIHTEPLATERSKEWAWQMRLLGYKVSHHMVTACRVNTKEEWMLKQPACGWQIYEPAEPDKYPNVEVGDIVYAYYPSLEAHIKKLGQEQDDMYSAVVEVLPTQFIVNNGFGFYKKDGSVSRIPGRQQFFDELCVLKIEKPTKEPEPAPRLKVGDWVKFGATQCQIISIGDATSDGAGGQYNPVTIKSADSIWTITSFDNLRKLDPSEVKVTLTLEGTVEKSIDPNSFGFWYGKERNQFSLIDYAQLSPDQAELVRELVED